jgi:hypothetical protein
MGTANIRDYRGLLGRLAHFFVLYQTGEGCLMATTNQLIRKGRKTIKEKSKVPAVYVLVFIRLHQKNLTQLCVKYAVFA